VSGLVYFVGLLAIDCFSFRRAMIGFAGAQPIQPFQPVMPRAATWTTELAIE
jgi:hypothetical protein